ncbi:MAG TPA: PQQ-dependent sugar dehydrogenase [Candidatus Sulfotelmatobacter sp.]|nr:PQQ-dependent sugar dehydrogenase [Candidatus Sulfotelmatobacter sp.]
MVKLNTRSQSFAAPNPSDRSDPSNRQYAMAAVQTALFPSSFFLPIVLVLVLVLVLENSASADPLPHIALQRVFPALHGGQRPVWMSEAPDGSGRMFIVYQPGTILIVKKGSDGSDAKQFLNIEARHPDFENEDGLLSMAFSPGFATNGTFYIYYTQVNSQQDMDRLRHGQPLLFPYRSVVSRMKVSASDPNSADIGSEQIIMEVLQPFWNHKGGELCFGPDGYLYLGLGDGGLGDDPFGNGQNTGTLLAKMLRIDVHSRAWVGWGADAQQLEYGFPPDNPYYNEPDMDFRGAHKEIFALGLRNPWRYSFDRQTGALWCGDVGQDLWEAIYIVVNGGNYGWSVHESGHPFKPGPPGAQYIKPVIDYPHRPDLLSQAIFPDHSIGTCVIGGYVYRGKKYPSLNGVYIYGDYTLGTIWGLRYDYNAHKVTAEGTLLQQPKNITSFAEDADGELYTMMDGGEIDAITVP